eukprot:8717179-Heterocapsa_arctica.AAC.1
MAAGDDDATMDASAPHYEDLTAEVERLRAEAEASVLAQANQERVRIEAMRLQAREHHVREVDESRRFFEEQFQRAQAILHAQRTAAQRE